MFFAQPKCSALPNSFVWIWPAVNPVTATGCDYFGIPLNAHVDKCYCNIIWAVLHSSSSASNNLTAAFRECMHLKKIQGNISKGTMHSK